jgi:ubiquinol-cytochrome c reductase cytochrome b/c1 subunit
MTSHVKLLALALLGTMLVGGAPIAQAAGEAEHPPRVKWSFSGPFGKFDRAQLQRGFKIYREVCQGCHSLSLVAFRNLAEPGGPGFSRAQAEAVAAEYKIKDGPNEQGEMFERAGRIADRFPPPFPNDAAARAANGGALPPDLSVMAKARTYERGFPWFVFDIFTQFQEQGVDYIDALLQGYVDKPQDVTLPEGSHYNKYFPGHAIGMPKPLNDGQVPYTDGSPQTVAQYANDVAAFLMWTAEPHMEARKRLGFQVMIFLLVFAVLLYFTKKKVWADVHANPDLLRERPHRPGEYNKA